MSHYIAIVEDAGPDRAVGLWFPDLPGCFAAGDDVDEALLGAEEAVGLFADAWIAQGKSLPLPRSLTALRSDPKIADDIHNHIVALVPYHGRRVEAAE